MNEDNINEIINSWKIEAPDVLPAGSMRQEEVVENIFHAYPRLCFRCDDYVECPW